MWKLGFTLAILTVLTLFLACEKRTGPVDPAKPSIDGGWEGTVYYLSIYPEEQQAHFEFEFLQCGEGFIGAGNLAGGYTRTKDGKIDDGVVGFTIPYGQMKRIEFSGTMCDSAVIGKYIVRDHGDSVHGGDWYIARTY